MFELVRKAVFCQRRWAIKNLMPPGPPAMVILNEKNIHGQYA
jgi:hypothetical protein